MRKRLFGSTADTNWMFFEKSYQKLKAAGLTVIVHTILYLPGEGEDDILETIKYLADLSPSLDGIKLRVDFKS